MPQIWFRECSTVPMAAGQKKAMPQASSALVSPRARWLLRGVRGGGGTLRGGGVRTAPRAAGAGRMALPRLIVAAGRWIRSPLERPRNRERFAVGGKRSECLRRNMRLRTIFWTVGAGRLVRGIADDAAIRMDVADADLLSNSKYGV